MERTPWWHNTSVGLLASRRAARSADHSLEALSGSNWKPGTRAVSNSHCSRTSTCGAARHAASSPDVLSIVRRAATPHFGKMRARKKASKQSKQEPPKGKMRAPGAREAGARGCGGGHELSLAVKGRGGSLRGRTSCTSSRSAGLDSSSCSSSADVCCTVDWKLRRVCSGAGRRGMHRAAWHGRLALLRARHPAGLARTGALGWAAAARAPFREHPYEVQAAARDRAGSCSHGRCEGDGLELRAGARRAAMRRARVEAGLETRLAKPALVPEGRRCPCSATPARRPSLLSRSWSAAEPGHRKRRHLQTGGKADSRLWPL
jgi:hypothetical protein